MKIIDILNKIANGEEPKIKYDNVILKYNKNEKRFIDKDRLNSLYEIDFSELNGRKENTWKIKSKIRWLDYTNTMWYWIIKKDRWNNRLFTQQRRWIRDE